MANDEALARTDRQWASPRGRKGTATLRKTGRLVPVSMRLGVWNRVKLGECACDDASDDAVAELRTPPSPGADERHFQTKTGSARIADETWEQQNRNTLLSITK